MTLWKIEAIFNLDDLFSLFCRQYINKEYQFGDYYVFKLLDHYVFTSLEFFF